VIRPFDKWHGGLFNGFQQHCSKNIGIAANRLQWLNGQMADGRDYLCGKRFTLADILLYGWLDFADQVGQPLDTANANIVTWMARVGERPSAKA
jgi:glutathione S-transferase